MSHYDYLASEKIDAEHYPFYALIMAAMRQANTANCNALKVIWPEVWAELDARYHAPGGYLPNEAIAQADGDNG